MNITKPKSKRFANKSGVGKNNPFTLFFKVIWMTSLAYGNSHKMIRFDVRITETMVDELIDYGSLDEDFNFDFEAFDSETDGDYVQEMATPILEAIIDYYDNKVESFYEDLTDEEIRTDEWASSFNQSHELDRICMWNEMYHPFRDKYGFSLVEIHDVDPARPYGWL